MKKHVFLAALAAGVLGLASTSYAQTDMPVRAKAKIKDDKVKMRDLTGEKNELSAKKGTVKSKTRTPDGKAKIKTEPAQKAKNRLL